MIRDAVVVPAVSWSVRNILVTVVIAAAFVAAAIALVRTETVGVVVFDRSASVTNTIHADLRLPVGASFSASVDAAQRFVTAAQSINEQLDGTSIRSIAVKGRRIERRPGNENGRGRGYPKQPGHGCPQAA